MTADVTDADGSIADLAWDFGDGATATGTTAHHEYAANGEHTITLTATDDQGGVTVFTKTITVKTPPPVPTDAYGAQVAAGNPLIYWRLNDAEGTTATDYSRFGNDGVYVNGVALGVSSIVAGNDPDARVPPRGACCVGTSAPLVAYPLPIPPPA